MLDRLSEGGAANVSPAEVSGMTPVKGGNKGSSSDSVQKSGEEKSSNTVLPADSPELQQAMYIAWFSNNQLSIQPYGNKTEEKSVNSISSFNLEINNKMEAVATQVLNAWSDSIKKEVEADRRDQNSDRHRVQEAENLKSGEEAYLSTLTFLQRESRIEYNTATGVALPNQQAFAEGLDDLVTNSKKRSLSSEAVLPFVAGAILSAMPGSVAIGAMQVNPISNGVQDIMAQITPAYSVDLASLATLYINGAMNLAAIQTFKVAPGSQDQKIDYEYARNYSQQVLKIVSGSDFNNWAMSIITHQLEPGEQIDDKYVADLTGKLKLSLLSTALSFLYYMESSFKGVGGGISGQEFQDLVNGHIAMTADDPKSELVNNIKTLLSYQENPGEILSKIGDWIDDSSKGLNLTKVSPLFNLLKLDSGGIDLPLVA